MRIEICEVIDGKIIRKRSTASTVRAHEVGFLTDEYNHVLPEGYMVNTICVYSALELIRIYITRKGS